ncbi:TonB-dependent receptor [Brevundimonas sp. Leaf363]|uniref:TonB-dependent receptor n=1 Tax=Brevundimonas sp. Leaf363 TaxID=1736353 RepID=UPI000A3ED869|nr:TonB-dependent receptor [Brevundimonas sp. Leaf363]
MRGRTFMGALARSSSALALLTALSVPALAHAQDADTAQVDDVIVTGVRASLDAAMDIKRNSSGVVDAISAEDIGKFPDTNLAESLQRVSGVSINRVNGEGSEVTVRGFGGGFNLVTLNGRQMPTANVVAVGGDQNVDFSTATSRSFDFSNLASEGVSRLEVYKTGRAAIPSGGIGATVNIVTRRPLDVSEEGASGSIGVKAVHDASVDRGDDVTPEVSGLFNWVDDSHTFGVSLFGSYQRRDSAAASSTVNAWNIVRRDVALNPAGPYVNAQTTVSNAPSTNQLVAIPNDSRYHFSESSRERMNGQAVVQWSPSDSLRFTVDALYAETTTDEARTDQTNWFNRPFGQIRFDDNDQVATAVFLQETIGGAKDEGFEQQYRATKDTLESFGFNAQWDATDNLSFELDAHSSTAESTPNGSNGASSTLIGLGAKIVGGHSVDFSGDIPVQTVVFRDDLYGNNNGVLDTPDVGSSIARTNASQQMQEVQEIRVSGRYDFSTGGRFDFGAEYISSDMTSQRVQTQQTLGDWGVNNPGDVNAIAPGLLEEFCLTCRFDSFDPGSTGSSLVAFRGDAIALYNALSAAYAADKNPFNGVADAGSPVSITGQDYNTVAEDTWALYGQVTLEGDLGSWPYQVVAGVRYESTDVESTSLISVPTEIRWVSDNDFTRIVGATVQPVTGTGGYDNVLPALDFSIEPREDIKLRASFSRTLARADYGALFSATTVNAPGRPTALGGEATGNSGNPNLLPLVSDNLDFSAEWYFAPSSYVSVGYFDKRVRNFIGQGVVNRSLFDLRDPSSGAAGSNSGIAQGRLTSLGADLSDVNLFTYTALLIQNNGNTAQTDAQFNAQRTGPNGSLNQGFVDQVLAAYDISANGNDPLFNFAVSQPVNNREANIDGFEIAGQYFLGDTGFGIAGSYTIVNGDVEVDVGADPSIDQFALLGLSNSGNVTLIYDNHGVSARLAYNWRDKYLTQTNRDGSNRNPVFTAPFGTLDMNVSYDITDNMAVSFEAINLTSETVRTYGRSERQLYFAQELSPRYLLGLRARF